MADRRPARRVAGLDGIRALAVLGVMGVHQQFGWLPGGYYGVDAFFVLSGYLITTLLVAEKSASGGIRLGAFWARRARRLLPALLLMVVVVEVVARADPSVLAPPGPGGAAATLFFSANWYFVFQHVDYFAPFAQPSPLLPTWSLAIEEQFYLVWPLIVLAVLRSGRDRLRALFWGAVAGAIGSAVLMAALAPDAQGNPARVYYGTDTRAQAILVGAALALALARWGRPRKTPVIGGLAVAGTIGTALMWHFVAETSPIAFRGGFLVVSLAAAAVILHVVTDQGARLTRALAWWPLAGLGRISYGVYLWYWPVLLVLSEDRTHLGAYALFAARAAITVAIAAISFLLLERPVLRGAVTGRRALVAVPAGVAVALLVALAVPATATATLPAAAVVRRPHLKVLLVGDSAAGSLGVGLGQVAPSYGIQLMNDGDPGCSLSMDEEFTFAGLTVDPGAPCRYGDPGALLHRWRTIVEAYNPDVVVYVAHGDLYDQQVDGHWENIGEPAFDAYLRRRLQQAVDVLGAKGAKIVLLTQPAYEEGETTARIYPEDQLSREEAYDRLIRGLARSQRAVSVFDLGRLVSPGGRFASSIDGKVVRCTDGIHFTAAGGELVAPRLFPEVLALGAAHRRQSPEGRWPGTPPPTTPEWWDKLSCQV